MKTFQISALIAALALSAIQTVALASTEDTGARARTVSYADIDLSRPAGVAQLYRRIQRAAAYVCNPLAGRDARSASQYRACMDTAVANAVADVHAPGLNHYVAMRN